MRARTPIPGLAGLLVVALITALLVSACGAVARTGAATTPATPTATPSNLHIDVEVDLVGGFDDPTARCTAPLVALVSVAAVGPSMWNPANSGASSPSGWHGYTDPDPIITPVTFSSFRTLLDHRTAPTKLYLEHGGVIGSNIDHVDGYAGLKPGETAVVMFLPGYDTRTRQSDDDSAMYVTWAKPVDAQGRIVIQQATNEPGVGAIQTITEPLSQFEQQLASCPAK